MPNKHSTIPGYIFGLNLHSKIVVTQVCLKDSRNLTQNYLKMVLQAIKESKPDKVIVTHGTYTMPEPATFLKKNMRKKKIVILTGSLTH